MFEKILITVKGRLGILQEAIDRGLYDPNSNSTLEERTKQFTAQIQGILDDGKKACDDELSKKKGLFNRGKINQEIEKCSNEIFSLVQTHTEDYQNRLNLLTHYTKNALKDPKKCRDMSKSKCMRSDNNTDCHWIPGSDELGEWAVGKSWTERTNSNNLPTYVGTNISQKPRGCYPVNKAKSNHSLLSGRSRSNRIFGNSNNFNKLLKNNNNSSNNVRRLTNKEHKIMTLKSKNNNKNLTPEELAEKQLNKLKIKMSNNNKAKMRKRRNEMMARVKKLTKKRNSSSKGGKRKTRRRKKTKRRRKGKMRKRMTKRR